LGKGGRHHDWGKKVGEKRRKAKLVTGDRSEANRGKIRKLGGGEIWQKSRGSRRRLKGNSRER